MDIEDLTVRQARELASLFGGGVVPAAHPYTLGPVVLRTVTMHYVGRLIEVGPQELVLVDVCWLADSGRWSDFLSGSTSAVEIEPFPAGRVVVGRSAVIDCAVWSHAIPRSKQ